MRAVSARRWMVVLLYAFVGWALCGAIMGIGLAVTSESTTLMLHGIGAPVIFALLSWSYFRRFGYTTPLQTALVFLAFALVMDFLVAGLLIQGNLDMFRSVLGVWVPLALNAASTYGVGRYLQREQVSLPR